ncbi:hypothetical protein E5163_14830 [Marinicauda algicola]|uniref:Uncharacterized protein n=1 Tax=Marinicauda algicola TaxID=2029849 RepID=A0A4S2GW49_9PROT|nr:hypothetical protein [Marinicauda algicola]TGY87340.1 hypothetical protein E5163_14830 [Marinicauda algicola]
MKTLTPDEIDAWSASRQRYPDVAVALVKTDEGRLVMIDCAGLCWFARLASPRFIGGEHDDLRGLPAILTPVEGPYTAEQMRLMTGEPAIVGYARGLPRPGGRAA